MSVKLLNLGRWAQMADLGLLLPGNGDRARTVTLELNVTELTHFDVLHGRKSTFLRVVEPWECPMKISFIVVGDVSVIPSTDGEVWWYTDDGQIQNFQIKTESFTELEQRMEMTTEMELTISKANVRLETRRREVAELRLAAIQRKEAEAANADPETGEIEDDEPVDDDARRGEPSAPAGNADASEPVVPGNGDLTEPAAAADLRAATPAK